jgi:hypothetical protein
MTPTTDLERHRDLAKMLLVGRSLPTGLPWNLEQDHHLIAQERILWARLTPEEQAEEQQTLTNLWSARGAPRTVAVQPHWGTWATKLGTEVTVPDSAFGLPENSLRPYEKGIQGLSTSRPDMEPYLKWLWRSGFYPIAIESNTIVILIPTHRTQQEADRLLGMFLRGWPEKSCDIRGVYDPVMGQSTVRLTLI